MGNCQAAEAATVVIVHPGNTKIERIYWSVSATQIMNNNPGHYVAQVVTSLSAKSEDGKPLKHLKLLRPDDTLHIGQVYRLICFEDVLKEFAAKKCVSLGKLLKETGAAGGKRRRHTRTNSKDDLDVTKSSTKVEQEEVGKPESSNVGGSGSDMVNSNGSSSRILGGRHQHYHQAGQWRPALQSIAEVGS